LENDLRSGAVSCKRDLLCFHLLRDDLVPDVKGVLDTVFILLSKITSDNSTVKYRPNRLRKFQTAKASLEAPAYSRALYIKSVPKSIVKGIRIPMSPDEERSQSS